MRVKISQGNKEVEVKPAEVADLPAMAEIIPTVDQKFITPAEGDGEAANEVLDSMPDVPTCVKCKKKAAEVTDDGFCCKCQPKLPLVDDTFTAPVNGPSTESFWDDARSATDVIAALTTKESIPATDENLAKAEAQLNKDASSVVVPPRPSLEVETEVHVNLRPRIEAHLARMRAWDMRSLPIDMRSELSLRMAQLQTSFKAVGDWLETLRVSNFAAKTTPVTRLASKLPVGTRVTLREDQIAIAAQVYTPEQLGSLSVVKTTDTHVQVMADDGSNLGLFRIIHVVPK